jgi:GNAT superfamily N-acetyltransferase
MITALVEQPVDYQDVAALGNEAFGSARFDAEEIRWLYERSFSLGTTVVALRDNGRKIGQCAMGYQPITMDGIRQQAVQIVDLFLAKAFRSKGLLRQLYDEVERECIARHIRFALGMPNARAISVNERFFQFRPFLRLPVRVGVAATVRSSALTSSVRFDPTARQKTVALFARYRTPGDENGISWEEEGLFRRLCSPGRVYGLHATEDLLLISSTRTSRHVAYTLLCGFFPRSGMRTTATSVRAVVRAACRMWCRPIFAFVGFSDSLHYAPGFPLPAWLSRSPMLLQLRDFQPDKPKPTFHRYQALDFDFA